VGLLCYQENFVFGSFNIGCPLRGEAPINIFFYKNNTRYSKNNNDKNQIFVMNQFFSIDS